MGFSFQGLVETALLIILFETACLAWTGITPGKWVTNIKIKTWDGTKPSIVQAASRTFQVWAKGMWFGLPLLSVIPMLMAKNALNLTGSTSWDTLCGTRVYHRPVNIFRYVGIILTILSIMLVNVYFQALNNQAAKNLQPKKKLSIQYNDSYQSREKSITVLCNYYGEETYLGASRMEPWGGLSK